MSEQHYDLLVIGAGAAGSTAATTAASQGKRVALIERDKIGDTCLNYGCDLTKTLLHTAQLFYQAQHANMYGLAIPTVSTHWAATILPYPTLSEAVRWATDRFK